MNEQMVIDKLGILLGCLRVAKVRNRGEYCRVVIYSDFSGHIEIGDGGKEREIVFNFGSNFEYLFDNFVKWLIKDVENE